MRILLTANFSPWSAYSGGAQRSTHALATALVRRGHDVTVVFTRGPLERAEPPAVPAYRLVWAALPALASRRAAPLRPLTVLTVAAAVLREARRGPLDVVHGQGEEAAALPLLRHRLGFRFLMTPRYPNYPDRMLSERPLGRADKARLIVAETKYVLLGHALAAADACTATSASAAEAAVRAYGIARERISVVPNGIDEVFFAEPWVQRPAGLGRARPVLFFGRVEREKGVDVLLDALLRLGAAAPPCVVVGRGAYETGAREVIDHRQLDVTLRPWADARALARLVRGAALVVLPSREESFGNAVAEAMAIGAPVISTTAGSIPELIRHGETGWLTRPGDPADLALAIASLQRDPARAAALGAAARRDAAGRFRWDAVAAAHEHIYAGPRGAPAAGVS